MATAKANITPKPITVRADDKSKVYGSADPALTVTVPDGALESGDSLSGDLERAAGKDVGGYAITKGSLSAGDNYDLTVTPGTLTITKKAITVAADDKTKVYGSADPGADGHRPGRGSGVRRQPLRQPRAGGRQRRRQLRDHEGQPDRRRQLRPHGHARHAHDHQEGDHCDRRRQDQGRGGGRPSAYLQGHEWLARTR